MSIRVYWLQAGAHVSCRVFTNTGRAKTYAYAGQLTFTEAEFFQMRSAMNELQRKHGIGFEIEFFHDAQTVPIK